MQNKHKFRIWDKKEKIMHYDDFVITATGYIALLMTVDNQIMYFDQKDLTTDDNKDLVVMQCMGAKDCNKNLIFEGDILKDKNGQICHVINDGYGFWVQSFGSHACDFEASVFYSESEKIGNIYENPELNPENMEEPDECF